MPTSVAPQVYIVGYSVADLDGINEYLLQEVSPELENWSNDHNNGDEIALLTEFGGRLCYKSWAPGINPNVTRIREDQQEYIKNIIEVKHGSVMEHAMINFVFANVSRVFTHELVRHRVGTAMSQESMRYVRLTDIPFWMSDTIKQEDLMTRDENNELLLFEQDSERLLSQMEAFQQRWADSLALDDGKDFTYKKQMTSALRRWSPQGVATQIMWSCNPRELRHVIVMRTDPSAEEEIRLVFDMVAQQVQARWPTMFGDLERQDDGSWKGTVA